MSKMCNSCSRQKICCVKCGPLATIISRQQLRQAHTPRGTVLRLSHLLTVCCIGCEIWSMLESDHLCKACILDRLKVGLGTDVPSVRTRFLFFMSTRGVIHSDSWSMNSLVPVLYLIVSVVCFFALRPGFVHFFFSFVPVVFIYHRRSQRLSAKTLTPPCRVSATASSILNRQTVTGTRNMPARCTHATTPRYVFVFIVINSYF